MSCAILVAVHNSLIFLDTGPCTQIDLSTMPHKCLIAAILFIRSLQKFPETNSEQLGHNTAGITHQCWGPWRGNWLQNCTGWWCLSGHINIFHAITQCLQACTVPCWQPGYIATRGLHHIWTLPSAWNDYDHMTRYQSLGSQSVMSQAEVWHCIWCQQEHHGVSSASLSYGSWRKLNWYVPGIFIHWMWGVIWVRISSLIFMIIKDSVLPRSPPLHPALSCLQWAAFPVRMQYCRLSDILIISEMFHLSVIHSYTLFEL